MNCYLLLKEQVIKLFEIVNTHKYNNEINKKNNLRLIVHDDNFFN